MTSNCNNGIAAVMFDMDGTLVDSEPLQHDADMDTFRDFGLPDDVKSPADYLGVPESIMFRDMIARFDLKTTADAMQAVKREHLKRRAKNLSLTPHARRALDWAKHSGRPVSVVTASSRDILEYFLERLRLTDFFDAVVSGTDPDIKCNKPAPDVYLKCAERLGVSPDASLAFEDSLSGVQSATRAGMRVVVVLNEHYTESDFSPFSPTLILKNGFADFDPSLF